MHSSNMTHDSNYVKVAWTSWESPSRTGKWFRSLSFWEHAEPFPPHVRVALTATWCGTLTDLACSSEVPWPMMATFFGQLTLFTELPSAGSSRGISTCLPASWQFCEIHLMQVVKLKLKELILSTRSLSASIEIGNWNWNWNWKNSCPKHLFSMALCALWFVDHSNDLWWMNHCYSPLER